MTPFRTVPVCDFSFQTADRPGAVGRRLRVWRPAFTIVDEIMPTLTQFRTVRRVRIYDLPGHTEHPAATPTPSGCLRR